MLGLFADDVKRKSYKKPLLLIVSRIFVLEGSALSVTSSEAGTI